MKLSEKTCSIRQNLFRVVLASISALVAVCFIMLAADYQSLANMRHTIDRTSIFNSFYDQCSALSLSLGEYLRNPGDEQRTACSDDAASLEKASAEMAHVFKNPRFIDNSILTGNLTACVRELLQGNVSSRQKELFRTCEKLLTYLDNNRNDLASLSTESISKSYQSQFRMWQTRFLLLILLLSSFAVYISLSATDLIRGILKPILDLTQKARLFMEQTQPESGHRPEIKAGSTDPEIKYMHSVPQMTETQLLTDSFNVMTQTIQKQMTQLQDKIVLDQKLHELQLQNINMQLSLTEAKMQLIQSMISPHFLFNCLSTLAGTAYLEHAPRTRDISLKMAVFLRDSLGLVGQKITMAREFEHTVHYIEIQKIRFGDRILFETELNKDCENIMIPAMILQPLVENAISHGVKNRMTGGLIRIAAGRTGEQCCLSVSDNGEGIDSVQLNKIRSEIDRSFEPGVHTIGLHSVASRIQASFPGTGKTVILSSPAGGTRIEIRIPVCADNGTFSSASK